MHVFPLEFGHIRRVIRTVEGPGADNGDIELFCGAAACFDRPAHLLIGRIRNKFDDCVIKEAVEKMEKNNYQAGLLVEHIVLSYQFRHRFCKK